MPEKKPVELIFPTEYPVKVFGHDSVEFIDYVIEVVSRHVPELTLESFTTNRSSGGKYVSVSVTFIAESRQQVDALYEELGRDKRVLTAF